jgi:hypothetical protein
LLNYVDMYVARASWPSSNGKVYQSIYCNASQSFPSMFSRYLPVVFSDSLRL